MKTRGRRQEVMCMNNVVFEGSLTMYVGQSNMHTHDGSSFHSSHSHSHSHSHSELASAAQAVHPPTYPEGMRTAAGANAFVRYMPGYDSWWPVLEQPPAPPAPAPAPEEPKAAEPPVAAPVIAAAA